MLRSFQMPLAYSKGKRFKCTDLGARVHRRLVFMYFLNVPRVSSPFFQQNKTNVSFRKIVRLFARNPLYTSSTNTYLNRCFSVVPMLSDYDITKKKVSEYD